MTTHTVRKITISLSSDLVEYADAVARRAGTNRSRIIAKALEAEMAREQERLAAEGYVFYAEEASAFAQASADAVYEAFGYSADAREDEHGD